MYPNLLKGKRGVILGLANDRSIAYGIAKHANFAGAELALTYQSSKLELRASEIASKLGNCSIFECDVTNDESIAKLFRELKAKWGKIDFLVHSVAFANKENFSKKFYEVSKDDFLHAMDVSCYSLVNVVRHASDIMNENGAVLTLSYLGAQKVIPNYHIMGVAKAALEASVRYLACDLGARNIRVNALSPGPMRTLASSAIPGFNVMMNHAKELSPLARGLSLDDIAGSALYLISDLSSAVTGEVHYVDCGYNIT